MYNFVKTTVAIACFVGVVSCSDTTPTSETENNATETSQITISPEYVSPLPESAPTLMVAIEKDAYPPFEYQNEYGVHIGYDIDLIRAIAEEAGFKVQMNFIPFPEVLPSLNTGKNDIAISALTASAERTLNFDASPPYIQSESTFIVKEGSDYTSANQLLGKKIAVQEGGFQEKELIGNKDAYNLIPVKTNFLAFQSILLEKSEALYADKIMLMYLSKQFPEQKIRYIAHSNPTNISIFTKKGNDTVMAKINEGLNAIQSNGRYQEINTKWFGSNSNTHALALQ